MTPGAASVPFCGSQHEGYVCQRPVGHKGKHRHSGARATWPDAPSLRATWQRKDAENAALALRRRIVAWTPQDQFSQTILANLDQLDAAIAALAAAPEQPPADPEQPQWAHTAANDPAGLYDDEWERRRDPAAPPDAPSLRAALERLEQAVRARAWDEGEHGGSIAGALVQAAAALSVAPVADEGPLHYHPSADGTEAVECRTLHAAAAPVADGQRWAHLDNGGDPVGRAAAEAHVLSIEPALAAAEPEAGA